jgi:lipopolysaccharide transport system ATP-binding protein
MPTVISVENVSKQYRLGEVGTGTLSHDINRWWHRVRGKEDPYLKIGEVNDRTKKAGKTKPEGRTPGPGSRSSSLSSVSSDYSWALRDVSFEVKQGEVLGIIGRNGAGKSTLLKILSRVTSPTTGEIKVKGRIASLLEVGTGFHPELTGRENIFLNGAILGMRKHEIASKFDEIVDFSGCDRYIDTPVKRYSSGMYVRLAFAVAAHLEPEILIIDEVLAVGDAEFQKKCLGKMHDVSAKDGRTVLFVSHNMLAVTELCGRAVFLKNGLLELMGPVEEVVATYLKEAMPPTVLERSLRDLERPAGVGRRIQMTRVRLVNDSSAIAFGAPLVVEMEADAHAALEDVSFGVGVNAAGGTRLLTVEAYQQSIPRIHAGQSARALVVIPETGLAPGTYTLSVGVNAGIDLGLDYVQNVLVFEVVPRPDETFYGARPGMGLRPRADWSYTMEKSTSRDAAPGIPAV